MTQITTKEIHATISAEQTHCYSCGNQLPSIKYRCPICDEFSCSIECRDKHIKEMDEI